MGELKEILEINMAQNGKHRFYGNIITIFRIF